MRRARQEAQKFEERAEDISYRAKAAEEQIELEKQYLMRVRILDRCSFPHVGLV